jgi:hypothetical protein
MSNFFKTLYRSFYDKELYAAAAHSGSGSGLGILAKLALVGSILIAIALFSALGSNSYSKFKKEFIVQIPTVTIQNGTLEIDKPSPYYIKFQDTPEVVVIDTSPATSAKTLDDLLKDMHANKIKILATKTKFISIKEDGEYQIKGYPESAEKLTFNQTDVKGWLRILEIIFIPIIALFMFIFLFVYKLMQAVIYSLFTLVFDKFVKNNLEYDAILRITVLAILPSTIFGVALMFFGSDLPFLLSIICNLVFIFFGLKSAKTLASK